MNVFKLASRNIWRNKRRAVLTASSICAGIFFALLIRSFQLGAYSAMIDESIGKVSGYVQIQQKNFYEDPSVDYSFINSNKLLIDLSKIDNVKAASPRIETGALAASKDKSKPVLIMGIDPVFEKFMSNPKNLLINYVLTKSAIKGIGEELELKDDKLNLLESLEDEAYNRLSYISDDLELSENEFNDVSDVFAKYAKVDGSFLKHNDQGVLVAEKLAKYLKINIGDTLILIGAGYHGASAAGLFPVRGYVKSTNPNLNNKLIYMSLSRMQEFLDMKKRINYIAINLYDKNGMNTVQQYIKSNYLDDSFVVKNWQELNPSIYKMIESDNQSGIAIIVILYFIIFFGIIGTVMMMLSERKHEFAVLNALGMKKIDMKKTVIIETIMIAIVGVVVGICLSIFIIIYFNVNPIEFTGATARAYEQLGFAPFLPAEGIGIYFLNQILAILFMVVLACYIPLRRIGKMKIIKSLRP